METSLRIDQEFQEKIPPLTEAEFKQLEENIVADGEVREPLIVWEGIIVDGHNRWKIINKHPEIPYKTKEMSFTDKWEAFDWMYRNQLGRRNLTVEQSRYLLGKLYEARKHTFGGTGANRYTVLQRTQSGYPVENKRVSDQIAEEQKVGKGTVLRAYEFSRGIDAIKEEDPEVAESILKAEKKISRQDIQDIGKAKPEQQAEMIQAIKEGGKPQKKEKPVVQRRSKEEIEKEREELQSINEVANDLFKTGETAEYGINSFLQDIETNMSPFIRLLSQMVERNEEICRRNKEEVIKAIHESTILKIEEIEKEIEGYE